MNAKFFLNFGWPLWGTVILLSAWDKKIQKSIEEFYSGPKYVVEYWKIGDPPRKQNTKICSVKLINTKSASSNK